jgi:hypothetical protein
MQEDMKSKLVGSWIFPNGKAENDEIANFIEKLVKDILVLLGTADGGWIRLYRHPRDETLWRYTYPLSEMHGGGPPSLEQIDREEAMREFPGVQL